MPLSFLQSFGVYSFLLGGENVIRLFSPPPTRLWIPSPTLRHGYNVQEYTRGNPVGLSLSSFNSIFSTRKRDSCLFSSSSTDGQSVCIIWNEGDDGHGNSSNSTFYAIAKKIALKYSLPLISQEENIILSDTKTDDLKQPFTHALQIVPYQATESSSTSAIDLLENYAIAIRPLHQQQSLPSRKQKRQQRKGTKSTREKPFFIDLCPPTNSRMGKRSAGGTGKDLLLRAVALRKGVFGGEATAKTTGGTGAVVFDLTAGMGQDALLMASAGAKHVTMVERNPIIALLLRDALRRLRLLSEQEGAGADPRRRRQAVELSQRLSLVVGDGRSVIKKLLVNKINNSSQQKGDENNESLLLPDIVYLDPMFPPRTKSAAVKKNMQILHGLFFSDDGTERGASRSIEEEATLLQAAWEAAKYRVVVKRPIKADPLGAAGEEEAGGLPGDPTVGIGQNNKGVGGVVCEDDDDDNLLSEIPTRSSLKPSYSVRGTVNRWDVYVKQ